MRRTFSRLRLILCGALCIFWCATASAYSIGFSPNTSSHPLNGLFSVDVVVSGLETDGQILSVYDLTVGFDLTLLQFVNAQENGALGSGSLFLFTPGAGFVNLFELSALLDAQLAALQGDFFTIATLSFIGIDTGTSPLALNIFALGGAQFLNPVSGQLETTDLLALPHTVGSATVTIVPNGAPEPGTHLLLALALPLLAARVRRWRR
jgi:hypothetical protein